MIVGALWESNHFVYHTLASVAKLRHHRRQHHQFSSYYQVGFRASKIGTISIFQQFSKCMFSFVSLYSPENS